MYRDITILKLVPDRPGRGGTKFGYHSFQQEPINDTRETLNVHIWQDSWRADPFIAAPLQFYNYFDEASCDTQADKTALALHGYSKFSLTDPTVGPATEILGHNVRKWGGTTRGYIWNYTTSVDTAFDPPAGTKNVFQICEASVDHPAVFCNIGNRCFIATGIGQVQVYDSSHGAAAYFSTGTPTAYPLGVGTPTFAPIVDAPGVVYGAAAYARTSSPYLSYPDPLGALNNASTPGGDYLGFTADGVTYDPATGGPPPTTPTATSFSIDTKTAVFSTSGKTIAIGLDENIATLLGGAMPAPDEWVGLTLTADGKTFVIVAQENSVVPEAVLVDPNTFLLDRVNTGNYVGTWFFPADDVTPPSIVSGFPFTITGVRWNMKQGGGSYLWAGGLTADMNTVQGQLLDGPGGVNAGGALTWDTTPPTYAYAWYDPITGHISNISPTFTPTVTTVTEQGIRINVDAGQISYPPNNTLFPKDMTGLGPPRFTHILFFRTLMAGGSTLYPIGSLQPSVPPAIPGLGNYPMDSDWKGLPNNYIPVIPPPGTGNYWYDNSRDSDLLISGALRAPQFTNGRPVLIENGASIEITPSHMAYWDGRLWLSGPQDASALHYSCDRVQCPFGVPEESFPDTNVLRIPASDGCIRGMKLIGESLLITTEKWAYTIAGNNEANYRLIRVSTRMPGVGDYQMAEFVPEVEGQTSLVVFIGTDARVYAMPLGGEATPISKDIQTYLTDARLTTRTTYAKARIHTILTEGRRMVVLYCPAVNGGGGKTLVFDFDSKTWSEHTLTSTISTGTSGTNVAWATIQTQLDYGAEIYSQPDEPASGDIGATACALRVWQWMNGDAVSPNVSIPGGSIRTFPLTFDGKKTRKRLHFVRLYVSSEAASGWGVTVLPDSNGAAVAHDAVQEYDPAYRQMAAGGSPIDSGTDAELIATDAALSPDKPLLGYTFDIKVTFPSQIDQMYRLYRMEVGWSTASEGQEDI